jgi:hypothetical protein
MAFIRVVVVILGCLLTAVALVLIVSPSPVLEFGRSILSPGVLYIAALFRVLFGVALLLVASGSRAPPFLRILGTVLIIAGLATPLVGVNDSRAVFDWMLAEGPEFNRSCAATAAVLGAFIVYVIDAAPWAKNAG